jgi:hypothetical protein
MFANTNCARHLFGGVPAAASCLVRRLTNCALIAFIAIVLVTGSAESQNAPAPDKSDEPPPLDELLKSLPSSKPKEPSGDLFEFHRTLRCESGKLSCNDPVAFGAQAIYARIRECWHPPFGTKITTAIFFGQSAAQSADPAVATLAFTLDTDGTLSSHPHLSAPAALGGAVNDLVRAVEHCQPYNLLPSGKYPEWKDVLLRIRIEQTPGQREERSGHSDKPRVSPASAFRG